MEPSNCYFQQENGGKKSSRYVSSLGATLIFNRINKIQGVGQTQKKHIRQSLAMYNLLIYQVQTEGGSYKMDKLMKQINVLHVFVSHDGSMVLVYMLTWLGYIDGIHVTIYGSTMDPSWVLLHSFITWNLHVFVQKKWIQVLTTTRPAAWTFGFFVLALQIAQITSAKKLTPLLSCKQHNFVCVQLFFEGVISSWIANYT